MNELQNVKRSVLTPLLQAGVTGFLVGFVVWGSLYSFEFSYKFSIVLGFWSFVTLLTWLVLLRDWQGLQWAELDTRSPAERVALQPVKERQKEVQPVTKVQVSSNGGKSSAFMDLPISREKMTEFSRGLKAGVSLAEGPWCGKGKLFSLAEFRTLRDEMLKRDLIRWSNARSRKQGLQLSPIGRALVGRFAGQGSDLFPTLRSQGVSYVQ